jgi:hypothetical protein
MSKGWTIEVAIEDPSRWGSKTISLQSFDVAIEDQNAAEEAVRLRAGTHAIIRIARERYLPGLSAGRVRSRPAVLVPRSRLVQSIRGG